MQNPSKKPDRQWLLLLIAALGAPEHPVFAKDYEPPTPSEVIKPLFKQALVDNRDGFFDNSRPVSEHFIKLQRREFN